MPVHSIRWNIQFKGPLTFHGFSKSYYKVAEVIYHIMVKVEMPAKYCKCDFFPPFCYSDNGVEIEIKIESTNSEHCNFMLNVG